MAPTMLRNPCKEACTRPWVQPQRCQRPRMKAKQCCPVTFVQVPRDTAPAWEVEHGLFRCLSFCLLPS
jgi:hypothetical protein